MTLDRLSENIHLPFDRQRIIKGCGALADYLNDLIKDIEQKHILATNYYVNRMRQTMTPGAAGSCDLFFPFTLRFKIPSEMVQVVSVLLSFTIGKYRADSTAASSGGGATSSSGGSATVTSASGGSATTNAGGGQTSSAGGGQTTSSGGGQTTSSGGGQTTSSGGGDTSSTWNASGVATELAQAGAGGDPTSYADGSGGSHRHSWEEASVGHSHYLNNVSHSHTVPAHTHTVNNHTHTVNNHTHTVSDHTHTVSDHTHTVSDHTHGVTVPNHTHTVPAHTHGLTYGIYEYTPASPPTVYFQVDNGSGLGPASDDYTTDQLDIDITSQITSAGWKSIEFHVSDLCYISATVEVKVNITTG